MKIHLFHLSPYGVARILAHLIAGYRLCRACGGRLRDFIPGSINSMTAAWNTFVILRSHLLSPPRTIVDVGANESQMIRLLKMAAEKGVRIVSFEPNPEIKPDGEVFREALSDRDDEGELFVPRGEAGWGSTTRSPLHGAVRGLPIMLRRFDSLVQDGRIDTATWERPVLVKVDTEGGEYAVLSGFGDQLKQIDYLLIEVENQEQRGGAYSLTGLSSLLYSHGFDKAATVSSGFNGPDLPPYTDVFFWRSKPIISPTVRSDVHPRQLGPHVAGSPAKG